MFEIALRILKMHLKTTILTIFLLTVFFYMTTISAKEYIQNFYEKNYIHHIDESLYLIPYLDGEMTESEDEIGMVREDIVTNEDTSEDNACWYVNEFYSRHFIHNIKGSSLHYGSGQKEVLIYGSELEKKYSIGDRIPLNGVEYTVVGFVSAEVPLFSLNYRFSNSILSQKSRQNIMEDQEFLDHVLQYPLNGDMYLVNDDSVGSGGQAQDMMYVTNGFIAHQHPDTDVVSMAEVKTLLLDTIQYQSRFHLFQIFLLCGMAVFVMVSMSIIQYKKCSEYMGVYQLCGMSAGKYHFLSIFVWIISLLTAFILDLLLYTFTGSFENEKVFLYPIRFIGAMVGVSLIVMCFFNLILQRKAVVEVLKDELY